MAGFRRNLGMRIDHILTNMNLINKVTMSAIDKEPRKSERPSDHTPVIIEI
jgi:exodeoxyribonuclease-3